MKRGFDGFNKSQAGSGETQADFKHRTLLDEFLELQKEFVAKKRKLKTAKQRRDILMGEILFLRRRHRYLLNCQSCDMELAKDEGKVVGDGRYSSGYEAKEEQNNLKSRSNLNLRYDEVQGSNGEAATKGTLRIEKMPKDYLIDDKRVGKKKLYRHGRVTVKHLCFLIVYTCLPAQLHDWGWLPLWGRMQVSFATSRPPVMSSPKME